MVPVIRREPSGSFQVLPAHKPERTCISASFELSYSQALARSPSSLILSDNKGALGESPSGPLKEFNAPTTNT